MLRNIHGKGGWSELVLNLFALRSRVNKAMLEFLVNAVLPAKELMVHKSICQYRAVGMV